MQGLQERSISIGWNGAVMLSGNLIPHLTPVQWHEDLQFLARQVTEQHKNAFHRVSREQFTRAVAALDARLSSLQDYEIVVGLQTLTAMIGDGHTFLATDGSQHVYPVEVSWFGRELRVVRTTPSYAQALGMRLIEINGTGIEDVNSKIQPLIPQAENEWYVLNQSARWLMCADVLAAVGIVAGIVQAPFTFSDDTAQSFTLSIASVAPATVIDWRNVAQTLPLYLQQPGEPFWFTYLTASGTMYVNFRGYNSLAHHAPLLFTAIDSHTPQHLVIDMRQNGGGNYTLARSYLIAEIQSRPHLNSYGCLFVLTGRATFSAAMTNVTDFRRETDVIIAGEPTGARPQGYQENYWLRLPHSGLQASVACRRYKFTDEDVPAVLPDQQIHPNWADYKVGRDTVLEWVLAYAQTSQ
jgi:hypothetical protein